MAHDCPVCYSLCFCNGDIDDCCFNFTEDILKCTHCDDEITDDDCE